MKSKELKDLEEYYLNSKDNLVQFKSGHSGYGDLKEFLGVVDFFAQRYGLGGHKSLDDFADMIDNSDPVLLNLLRVVAVERDEKQWGTSDTDNDSKTHKTPVSEVKTGYQGSKTGTQTLKSNPFVLKKVLYDFGVPNDVLKKASADIAQRKIEFKDYSWLNNENLRAMSQEKFHELLKEVSGENSKAINFNVSLDTLTLGEKKHGRK
jgi:hypothetical protein